jgi:ribose 5-phosphate isomerase A
MDSKRRAAEKAVEFIKDGMVVGLGTGSTAFWAIEKIGENVKNGMQLKAVATSVQTEKLARERNIPIVPFEEIEAIDLTIDGADEVDKHYNLLKGGGGALLREKIVAFHTSFYIVVVDESKLVEKLGRFPLPLEIVPFGADLTLHILQENFGKVNLRKSNGKLYSTDNGNLIADVHSFPIEEPARLDQELHAVPGVIETGLFSRSLVSKIIVGTKGSDIRIITVEK